MDYEIRDCKREDLPSLLSLCESHAMHEQSTFDPRNKIAGLEQAIFSPSPKLYCWIVERHATRVGYCTYTFDFSTWDAQQFLYLDCLFLEPAYRGLGIGQEIIRRLIKEAQANECVNIQWQTPTFNVDAIKFYNRIGATGQQKERFTYTIQSS
ncbi:GNAT family N-acetyltransferase [Pseudochryseolinea flava]|uniref:GNAT family N-acetyltransferase n=1 Tax=Pseudochryseolinea flava TaxID=2059302 RepID=A0A364Y4M7_9BACT|nr:GNAT family N-acetyltransferase [Pseudochryseolinea flava]